MMAVLAAAAAFSCAAPYVVEGDTIRRGNLRVLLARIDAPELSGHSAHSPRCKP